MAANKETKKKSNKRIMEDEEVMSIDARFHFALLSRIKKVRKALNLKNTKKKKYKKGDMFKNDSLCLEGVLTAVSDSAQAYHHGKIVKGNEKEAILLSGHALGLNFEAPTVKKGWYDSLIKSILKRLAELDYQNETNIELH